MEPWNYNIVEEKYQYLKSAASDINEHLPIIKKYTEECDSILELGVRWIVAAYAFLAGNPKKYVGDVNRIVYRSLLERKFMLYCDRNPDITYWASEELAIRYYNPVDKKYHRYYPDFIVRTIKGDKILIEIKHHLFRQICFQHKCCW